MQIFKKSALKRCISGGMLGLLTMLLLGGSTSVHAAGCTGAAAAAGTCTMTVDITTGGGTLTTVFPASATITSGTPPGTVTLTGTKQDVLFDFSTDLVDSRGSTTGWSLLASSTAGMVNTNRTTAYEFVLTGLDTSGTPAHSICTSPDGICVPTVATLNTAFNADVPLPLATTTGTPFLSTGDPGGTVTGGSYTLVTKGKFSLPGNAPSGTYSGTIALTLAATF